MMFLRKILTLLCLMALTFVPLSAQAKKSCPQSVEQSIIHLEVLTEAYNQGELEYDIYMELVEKIDIEVEQKLSQCRSSRTNKILDFISDLSLNYKKAREELLNGTERVD